MAPSKKARFQLRSHGMPLSPLTILHVDMDAFYASVEQRDRPELRGQPVVVGGISGRGVVCAASYEARPFGVRSAMPMTQAKRLCPHAVFLPVRMSHYAEIGRQIREILHTFTPLVEPLSLDEAFLDIRGCEGLFGAAPDIARKIKTRIQSEIGLDASVGVAPNKFLAKLASDISKPNGLLEVAPEAVAEFLAPLPVSRLWGVGAKSERRLHALGLRTLGQLAAWPEQSLAEHFGEMGRHLWRLAHGQDDRPVVADRDAKSISTETTFAHDIGDLTVLRAWLLDLVDHLATRLRQAGVWSRTIDLKIRSADFQTRSRSKTLPAATNVTKVIWKAVVELFDQSLSSDFLPLRLLGVGAAKLTREPVTQGDLFDSDSHHRDSALDHTIDTIRAQFGSGSIQRGNLLNRSSSEREQPGD
jgi:DNA polymerase-4